MSKITIAYLTLILEYDRLLDKPESSLAVANLVPKMGEYAEHLQRTNPKDYDLTQERQRELYKKRIKG
jgi:hypothetical protein